MNIETPGFEPSFPSQVPSLAHNMPDMLTFGLPTHINNAQHPPNQYLPSSSLESSVRSRPYSTDSGESRTCWSSAETDWGRRGVGIQDSYYILQRENSELLKQIVAWKAKFETLQMSYNLLLDRIPIVPQAPTAGIVELPKLNPDDFKSIKYWYRQQWPGSSDDRITEINRKVDDEDEDVEGDAEEDIRPTTPAPGTWQRGQSRSRAGINVSMRYIEEKDGKIIDGHRARDIRIHARANFVGFAMQGKQFASWGDSDAVSRRTYYSEMAMRFEELRYCDLDWKADQIVIDTYPGWKNTWSKKQKKTLELEKNGLKRPHQVAVEKFGSKRSKSEAVEITSILSMPPSNANTTSLSQHPAPVVNIIPNTPVKPPPASFNMQAFGQYSCDPSLLQPTSNKSHQNFSINNPLATTNDTFTFPAIPLAEQFIPAYPAGHSSAVPLPLGGHDPAKRSRTGIGKMRPNKTSITPRNLCALEWTSQNPNGTTNEFAVYFDSLSAEEKKKWEGLSAEAKAAEAKAKETTETASGPQP